MVLLFEFRPSLTRSFLKINVIFGGVVLSRVDDICHSDVPIRKIML